MVRREEALGAVELRASRCIHPAGASPVPAGARAPGSRLLVQGEILVIKAERRKPDPRLSCGGEQARGPQHQVKPAASTELQPESRAGHVAAKATSVVSQSGDHIAGLGGVWGAARVHGEERNTRGPSAQPRSGRSASYKPTAKASRAQRESEGVVVCAGQQRAQVGWSPTGARMGSAISKSGSSASLASMRIGEGRVSTVRWNPKGLRRSFGPESMGAIPTMNRSAKEGARSSRHYGDEGVFHPPLEPRCVRPARSGRTRRDPRRSHRMLRVQGARGEGALISLGGEGVAGVR